MTVDEVHLWTTTVRPARATAALKVLTEPEVARARDISHLPSRWRYLVGRLLTRQVLAGYAEEDPRKLMFTTGPQGKPRLVEPAALQFSMAHSGCLVLLAVAWGRPVGVDIELLRDVDAIGLRPLVLSPIELAGVRDEAPEPTRQRILGTFVRKEAVLKGLGLGLRVPLDSIELLPSEVNTGTPTFTVVYNDQHLSLSVRDVAVNESYAAAVASCGENWAIRWYGDPARWMECEVGLGSLVNPSATVDIKEARTKGLSDSGSWRLTKSQRTGRG